MVSALPPPRAPAARIECSAPSRARASLNACAPSPAPQAMGRLALLDANASLLAVGLTSVASPFAGVSDDAFDAWRLTARNAAGSVPAMGNERSVDYALKISASTLTDIRAHLSCPAVAGRNVKDDGVALLGAFKTFLENGTANLIATNLSSWESLRDWLALHAAGDAFLAAETLLFSKVQAVIDDGKAPLETTAADGNGDVAFSVHVIGSQLADALVSMLGMKEDFPALAERASWDGPAMCAETLHIVWGAAVPPLPTPVVQGGAARCAAYSARPADRHIVVWFRRISRHRAEVRPPTA